MAGVLRRNFGSGFHYVRAISFQFYLVQVHSFCPDFFRYMRVCFQGHFPFRLANGVVGVWLPARVVRVLRRAIPLLVDVVPGTSPFNDVPISPDDGLCANVPFMRHFLFEDGARDADTIGPSSRPGLYADARRLVLRRCRVRGFLEDRYGGFFVAYAVDDHGHFLRRPSFLDGDLAGGVCRVMLGIDVPSVPINREGRRANDLCRLLQIVVVFRFQPAKSLVGVRSQANARRQLIYSLLNRLLQDVVSEVYRLTPNRL